MRLDEYLDSDFLITELSASTKNEVLAELVGVVCARYAMNANEIVQLIHSRESLGSTAIGGGIAIPHAKVVGLEKMVLVVARSTEGVPFDALDSKPVHALFMVLAPENAKAMHLRLLAYVSRLLKSKEFRTDFMQASDKDGLFELLRQS